MIDSVIPLFNPIADLRFITRWGGAVRTAKKMVTTETGGVTELRFPVSCSVDARRCYEDGTFLNLVPDSSQKGIAYIQQLTPFEVNKGVSLPVRYRWTAWTARARLVVWLNLPMLGQHECEHSVEWVSEIMRVVNNARNVGVTPISIRHKDADIFSGYTYDDRIKSMLAYPYYFFNIDYEVNTLLQTTCFQPGDIPLPLDCGTTELQGWLTHDANGFWATMANEIYELNG